MKKNILRSVADSWFIGFMLAKLYIAATPGPVYNNPQPDYNNQQQPAYADQPQTDQVFYDQLSPYGQWIDYPDYGYVWQPNADADFQALRNQWQTGYTAITAGPGYQITTGDGRHFIMAGGFYDGKLWLAMDTRP